MDYYKILETQIGLGEDTQNFRTIGNEKEGKGKNLPLSHCQSLEETFKDWIKWLSEDSFFPRDKKSPFG